MSERSPGAAGPLRCDGVVLRTPLLPVEEMLRWSAGTTAAQTWADGGDLPAALVADRRMLRERLAALVTVPHVREALHVAAPAVAAGIEAWAAEPETKRGRDLERSLTRYATRMATRATPFGLFSGCSVGGVGEQSQAELAPLPAYRRGLELDADAVVAMSTRISETDAGWRRARLYTNTTLANVAGGFHYAEWRDGKGGRSYDLSRLPDTPPLRAVLAVARGGATLDALCEAVQEQVPEAGRDDVVAYIDELVANKVLTSELEPPVTGLPPSEALLRTLTTTHPEHAAVIDEVRARLAALASRPLGASPSEYAAIRTALDPLLDPDHRHWLHCVLHKPVDALSLGPDTLAQISAAVAGIERLGAPSRLLREFSRAFAARYEEQFMPLAVALDPDAGISFGTAGRDASPLLDGMLLGSATEASATLGAVEQRLGARLSRNAHAGGELVLDDAMLSELGGAAAARDATADARAFAAMFSLAQPHTPGGPPEVILNAITGPSGAALLGRFCHGDPAIEALARAHTRGEEQGADVVYAEIVHTPEGRHANVIARPVLRAYEIAYLGRSGAPQDQQIAVDDLEVGIVQGRVVLRSIRLGRQVIPRLTCAHNAAASSLPIYRFLAAVAGQDAPPQSAWNWGSTLPKMFDDLPRVRIAGVVVSLARWACAGNEVDGLASTDPNERFAAFQTLRQRRGLPRWVSHGYADRLVVIDLDNVLAIDALAHALRGSPRFELTEVYPEPHRQFVSGPEGRYVGEWIAPMLRPRRVPAVVVPAAATAPRIQRSFPPGSPWLYARLYTSPAGVDRLLEGAIAPLMRRLEDERLVERWHFVRYGDPAWHVRVRAYGDAARLWRDVLPALQAAVSDTAGVVVTKTEIGTYEREVERYGGAEGIVLAESIFHLDSRFATACLRAVGHDAELRWQTVIAGIDATMAGLGLDTAARLEVMSLASAALAGEFSLGAATDNQLSQRYRDRRSTIDRLLGGDPASILGAVIHRELLEHRERLRPHGEAMQALLASGKLAAPLPAIVASLVHMHVNRLLRADARAQEYVMYDSARRHYRAALGRARRPQA